jgi:L-ascorbate metabolism protein UlaG (beta-lactamase superfamily)
MKKSIVSFILFLLTISSSSFALSITWYGTSCFYISDGKTAILFDPFLTRPSKTDIILFKDLESNQKLVDKWLPLEKRKLIKAMFVSHTHYDHVLDIGSVHKGSDASIYGSYSALKIAKANGIKSNFLKRSKLNQVIKIGDFEIETLAGKHTTHFFNFTWATGKVDKEFSYPATAMAYKMDEIFTYLIKYKDKTIYFNASTGPLLTKKTNVDIMIQGLTFHKQYNELIEKQIKPYQPKMIFPSHHDDFFMPLEKKYIMRDTADIEAFKKLLPKNIKFIDIKFGQEITI